MKYGEQDDGPLPHVYARYTARGLIGGKWQNENALTINDIVKARSIVCRFGFCNRFCLGQTRVACDEPRDQRSRSNGRYSSRYADVNIIMYCTCIMKALDKVIKTLCENVLN
jgi:hypothetical protein